MVRLKELRKSRGLSQKEFSKEIGVAQNTVSNWENGNRLMKINTATKIAAYFGVSTDYLLGTELNDTIVIRERIKKLRKSVGYSQEELAELLYVHQTAVSQWEQGRTMPDLYMVKKLAEVFGVSTDFLLGNKSEKKRAAYITDEDIMFVLFGGEKGVTPAMYEEVKQFAEMVKLREKERKRKEQDIEYTRADDL